jgi:hypothetical protein
MFNEQNTNDNLVFNNIDKDIFEVISNKDDEEDDDDEEDIFLALNKEIENNKNNEYDNNEFNDKENENSLNSSKKPKVKSTGTILEYLKNADKKLFNYQNNKGKKKNSYPTVCGWVDKRHPIVINEEQKTKIDKEFPGAYDNYVKTGSTEELAKKNYYICPKIWCPKSKVAMTYKQYQEKGNKCPYPNETPILFDKKYWADNEHNALTKPHYVNFLNDSTHPDNFCLPCCFKLQPKANEQKTCKSNFKEIENINENIDEEDVKDDKYILNEHFFPLKENRLGLLPKELSELLGNKKCGSRHDGTGLLKSETKCYLRKGIKYSPHSFLSCILLMLNLPFKSNEEFIKFIIHNLDIQKYLSLENGKIIKLFINNDFDIYNQDNFKEFCNWFLKQDNYIKSFNLYKLKKDLEGLESKFFNKNKIINFKDIIREFMIYNSFKHFINYLNDNSIVKDHRTLLDLFNFEHQMLNTQNIHIIIIDVDKDTNKSVLLCPFSRNVKEFINLNNPFLFIIKKGNYYEPLSYVEYNKNNLSINYEFLYEDSNINIKSIINYYINNCGKAINEKNSESIIIFLEFNGYKVKSFIIDFDFRIRGVLLKNNLYIPFKNKLDIYNVLNKSFIYYNDITDFKCLLSKEEICKIFQKLQDFTDNDNFYKVIDFILSTDKYKFIALKLTTTLIPLNLEKKNVLYSKFENNLEIFIESQTEDKRTKIMNIIKEDTRIFEIFFENVTNYINNNNKIRDEIAFLTNLQNPFPKNFKREKLLKILENINKEVIKKSNESQSLKERIDSNKDMQKFINKIIETFLLGININIEKKVFEVESGEVLLDQHEINNNKIQDIIEYQKDPFKLLSENFKNITDQYIFDKIINFKSITKIYIKDDTEFLSLPTKFKQKDDLNLKNFNIINNNNYNSLYLYSLFTNLNEFINPNKNISVGNLKSIIQTYIIHDYEKTNTNSIDLMFKNNSLLYNINKNVNKLDSKPPIDSILNLINSLSYYPSLYEIKIMADIIGINLVILGREGKNEDPIDGINVINKNSSYTIFLNKNYKNKLYFNQFDLFCKDKKIIIFKKKDIPEDFNRVIENKKKSYKINVDLPI